MPASSVMTKDDGGAAAEPPPADAESRTQPLPRPTPSPAGAALYRYIANSCGLSRDPYATYVTARQSPIIHIILVIFLSERAAMWEGVARRGKGGTRGGNAGGGASSSAPACVAPK